MSDKVPENVDGPFYVTEECIACGLCVDSAGACFKFNDDESNAFVYKQPENDEIKECREALDGCPVDAIKVDG